MEHGQIYSFLKTQTKTEVGFFRPSWVFSTAHNKGSPVMVSLVMMLLICFIV